MNTTRPTGQTGTTHEGAERLRVDSLMSSTAIAKWGAAVLVIAPAILLASFVYHPYLPGVLPNPTAVAEAVLADPTRWAVAHLLTGVGCGFLILAFLALRWDLRRRGEDRWSVLGLPFVVMGYALYALLPAMEFVPLVAAEIGADVEAAQGALGTWFAPLLFTSASVSAIGVVAFAVALRRRTRLSPGWTWFVVSMLLVMAAARFVPLFAVHLYVQGAASVLALWPLAFALWTSEETLQPHVSAEVTAGG